MLSIYINVQNKFTFITLADLLLIILLNFKKIVRLNSKVALHHINCVK